MRDKVCVAVVIHQLYGLSVHRAIEDVAVTGSRRKVLAELFLYEGFVVAIHRRMRILKRDAHALERDLFSLLIGHLVGITRDLNLLEHLAHRDRQAAIATLPDLFRVAAFVLRNHLGRDHDSHILLGKRGGINEHRMVAPKVHGFELRAIERTAR